MDGGSDACASEKATSSRLAVDGEIARSRKQAIVQALSLAAAAYDRDATRVYLDEDEDHVGSARLAQSDERLYS